jgi:hypothetical protein
MQVSSTANLSAMVAHPDSEFLSPSGHIITLDSPFIVFATALCGFFLYRIVTPNWAPTLMTVIQALVIFTALGIWFSCFFEYLKAPASGVSDHCVSISAFTLQASQLIARQPYTGLTGRISRSGSHCSPIAAVAVAVNPTDESEFPRISFTGQGPAVKLVVTTLTENLTAESLRRISQMETKLGKCREDQYPNPDLSHQHAIAGFVTMQLARENEVSTRGLGCGSSGAWGLLFAGIFSVYTVDSIPIVRVNSHS